MRFSALSLGLLAVLTPLSAAWSKEDHEIFRVRDELVAHEGADVTFYEYLGIARSASLEDINKAYKKKSRQLHPDKVKQQLTAERAKAAKERAKNSPGSKPLVTKPPTPAEVKAAVKRAGERQARLSIVANILRSGGRDRYDYFLSNGFPTWKGTEYYYSRYRPGLGTAIFGVFLMAGGGAHYVALYMGWKRQREFIERYIKFARHAAWGDNVGIPIPGVDGQPAAAPEPAPTMQQQMYEDEDGRVMPMNRKMRRMQERDTKKSSSKDAQANNTKSRKGRRERPAPASGSVTPQPQAQGSGPTGPKKRVVAENGKVLVVDSLGDVYLEQEDEDGNTAEFLLDPNEISRPTFADTAVVRLPLWAFQLTLGRLIPKRAERTEEDDEAKELLGDDDEEESEPGKATPSTDSAEDFELLEKSVDDLGQAKASGSQKQGGKAGKRKNKKR